VTIGEGSKARYRSKEQLANRNLPNDAVGETPDVSGVIAFGADGAVLQEQSKITVNLRTLKSDEDRRDNFIRENTIQTNRFPTAEFVVSSAPGLPWPLPRSGEATFQLQGNMTMHGVTSPMVWDATATFEGDKVTGQARSSFTFEQFDMDKPRVFLVLSVEDTVRLEVDFSASVSP
jgi:polyisoprenoid-binding protein YceI